MGFPRPRIVPDSIVICSSMCSAFNAQCAECSGSCCFCHTAALSSSCRTRKGRARQMSMQRRRVPCNQHTHEHILRNTISHGMWPAIEARARRVDAVHISDLGNHARSRRATHHPGVNGNNYVAILYVWIETRQYQRRCRCPHSFRSALKVAAVLCCVCVVTTHVLYFI